MNTNKKFIKSLTSTSASSLVDKIGEFTIDQIITDQVIKDIPIIGTALSLYEAGNEIQSYLYTKKLLKFLNEVESITQSDRHKFLGELSNSDKDKLGDNLLLIIDNIKELNAAVYLGRAFSLLVSGKIQIFTFYNFAHIINNLTTYLLQQIIFLYQYKEFAPVTGGDMYQLSSLGLLDLDHTRLIRGSEGSGAPTPNFEKTRLGQMFYDEIIVTNDPVIPFSQKGSD